MVVVTGSYWVVEDDGVGPIIPTYCDAIYFMCLQFGTNLCVICVMVEVSYIE